MSSSTHDSNDATFCKNKHCKFYQSKKHSGDNCKVSNLSVIAEYFGFGECYAVLPLKEKLKVRLFGHYLSLR